jgi:DNA-binding CsgD family transcriptional regulator
METRRTETISDQFVVAPGWVPPWVGRIGAPVWVSDLSHKILYINPRAEELLERPAKSCVGRNCYEITRGKLENGKSFCNARCEVIKQFRYGRDLEPVRLRVGIGKRSKWVQIVLIAAQPPDVSGVRLVHCVINDHKAQRFQRYLSKVMTRTQRAEQNAPQLSAFRLTSREREILEYLADDKSLHEIADKLHLSYTTVRNHVQHILAKLGVHSIMEAVAFYLLSHD